MSIHFLNGVTRRRVVFGSGIYHKTLCSGSLVEKDQGVTTTTISKITCLHCLDILSERKLKELSQVEKQRSTVLKDKALTRQEDDDVE